MRRRGAKRPRCIVIAGPNGAGKTTFAREFLPREAGVIHFVNVDLIASGLSPLRPELAARKAGRLVLAELSRLASARKDFAFESTLSGRTYLRLMKRWKAAGYRIEMVFLLLPSVELALQRIAVRVRQGGHDVPRADVVRRFDRSWKNFLRIAPSKILPSDRSLRHLQILPSDPAWGRAEGGGGWRQRAWRDDPSRSMCR